MCGCSGFCHQNTCQNIVLYVEYNLFIPIYRDNLGHQLQCRRKLKHNRRYDYESESTYNSFVEWDDRPRTENLVYAVVVDVFSKLRERNLLPILSTRQPTISATATITDFGHYYLDAHVNVLLFLENIFHLTIWCCRSVTRSDYSIQCLFPKVEH